MLGGRGRNHADDFPVNIKDVLAKRIGFRCSNPGCRQLTNGPQTDPSKAVNVGVAAHITAASPQRAAIRPQSLHLRIAHPSTMAYGFVKLVQSWWTMIYSLSAATLETWKREAESSD